MKSTNGMHERVSVCIECVRVRVHWIRLIMRYGPGLGIPCVYVCFGAMNAPIHSHVHTHTLARHTEPPPPSLSSPPLPTSSPPPPPPPPPLVLALSFASSSSLCEPFIALHTKSHRNRWESNWNLIRSVSLSIYVVGETMCMLPIHKSFTLSHKRFLTVQNESMTLFSPMSSSPSSNGCFFFEIVCEFINVMKNRNNNQNTIPSTKLISMHIHTRTLAYTHTRNHARTPRTRTHCHHHHTYIQTHAHHKRKKKKKKKEKNFKKR